MEAIGAFFAEAGKLLVGTLLRYAKALVDFVDGFVEINLKRKMEISPERGK